MTQMSKIKYAFAESDKPEIISALRQVAVAIAEYWDVLREIEGRDSVEIETKDELFTSLAGECNIPPSLSDLPANGVWQEFVDDVRVRRR